MALVATLALLSAISQQQGWTHGQLTSITVWLLAPLVLLMPLYRLGGKRRLMSAMEKRAATRPGRTA